MRAVVDSSAWIEWLTETATKDALSASMPSVDTCIVPTIVQFEVVKWLRRERGEQRADAFLSYSNVCIVEPLDTKTAMIAAEISAELKLAMADAIVLATARNAGAMLLTCDAHFEGLADVTYVKKARH